jgi:hypothetical protein
MSSTDANAISSVVLRILGSHFKLPKGAVAIPAGNVPGLEGILNPDFEIETPMTRYLVTVKQTLTTQDIAMALLARGALGKEKRPRGVRIEPVIVCKVMSPKLQALASTVGIHVFPLDWKIPLDGMGKTGIGLKVRKVSSEKSWRVVFALLRSGPISIKALAKEVGSSYGWAHATIAKLMDMGVASRTVEGVAIVDVGRLLNGVAWERPLEELRRMTMRVGGKDAMAAAGTVQSALDRWGIRHAFTAWTAGTIYTGYLERSGSVNLYLPRGGCDYMRELEVKQGGIELAIYLADRDVIARAERVQGLDLVEPAQALLDLAGLGFAAHDLALEMARHYARNVR